MKIKKSFYSDKEWWKVNFLFRARPWKSHSQRQFSLSAWTGFPDVDNHDSTSLSFRHPHIYYRSTTIHHFFSTWRYFQTEVSILLTCLLGPRKIFSERLDFVLAISFDSWKENILRKRLLWTVQILSLIISFYCSITI